MAWSISIDSAQNNNVGIKIHFDANHNTPDNIKKVKTVINNFCQENGFVINDISCSAGTQMSVYLYFNVIFFNSTYATLFSLHSNKKQNKNFRRKMMTKLNHKSNYNHSDYSV